VEIEASVRHEAVRPGGLIEMVTEVGISDPGVRVFAGYRVDLVAITALQAVEFETTGQLFHLKHGLLKENFLCTRVPVQMYRVACAVIYAKVWRVGHA
jgi:hypothetical protein